MNESQPMTPRTCYYFVDEAGDGTLFNKKKQITVEMGYQLYLPQEYKQKESWPLILFLHGAGERGDDLELVKKHGPPKLVGEGSAFSVCDCLASMPEKSLVATG